jgi:short subunit dehydrogenase-like uncharacterized protein
MNRKTKVVVYGGSGHTGQLVAAELVARGHEPLLAGRSLSDLERVASGLKGAPSVAVAEVGDASTWHAILDGADVLINCAGPHGDTSFPLALAAIDSGVHYLDTNAVEQVAAKRLFDDLSRAAIQAGIAIVPGMATFGGLGDLLASEVTRGLSPVATITVAYNVDGWIPTRGSMMTASRAQGAPRLTFEAGRFSEEIEPARIKAFDFGHAIGVRDVVENYPGVDVAMIPQHVLAEAVAVHMTLSTLQEFRAIDPAVAAGTDAKARKMTDFAVLVEARHGNGIRRMIARGKDIYGFTATMMGTAIDYLACGPAKVGVLSPAQRFQADTFLDALARQGLAFQTPSVDAY